MASRSSAGIDTVLVVDDNLQNRQIATAHLVAAGYAVSQAESGDRALEMFEEVAPALVVLDILMPGLDGFETCERLRSLRGGKDAAVLFLTALSDLGSHDRALASGADDFLTKPINRTELLLRVRSLIRIKRLHDELERGTELIRSQRDALTAAQHQKEELMALVVHDLKNPITSIMANAQYLLDSIGSELDLVEPARDVLDVAASMNRMVQNLLDISRSESGVLVPKWAEVDLGEVVREVLGEVRRRAVDRKQRLEVAVDPGAGKLQADGDLVRRLVENLVDNAIKYAPGGSSILVEATPAPDGGVLLRVRDEGPGVPRDYRERIFEKYVQLERDAARNLRTSRGLGLASCRLAAEVHGGRIWVEDNEPKGTVFCVLLPDRQPAA